MNGRLRARVPIIGLAVNAIGTPAGYFLVLPDVGDATQALAIAGVVPVGWILMAPIWRRRVDALGALVAAGYGVALAIAVLTGGGALALEAHEPVVVGLIGLGCLVSVAVGKPLGEVVGRAKQLTATETAIVGTVLIVHAVTLVTLALSVTPSRYVALHRLIGLPVLGLGVIVLVGHRWVRSSD